MGSPLNSENPWIMDSFQIDSAQGTQEPEMLWMGPQWNSEYLMV